MRTTRQRIVESSDISGALKLQKDAYIAVRSLSMILMDDVLCTFIKDEVLDRNLSGEISGLKVQVQVFVATLLELQA